MPDAHSSDSGAPHEVSEAGTAPRKPWSWPRFARNAVLVAGAIAAGIWAWDQSIEPNLFPKNFGVVSEGVLYRSGELTPRTTRLVARRHGIRTIIDLGAHIPGTPEERRAQATADALGIRRVRVDLIGDAQGDPNDYAEALRVIADPENQPVLVHCAAGSQRTGCLVAVYRTGVEGSLTIDEALEEAQRYRHDPSDNPMLPEYARRWHEAIAEAAVTGETIPYDGPTQSSLEGYAWPPE